MSRVAQRFAWAAGVNEIGCGGCGWWVWRPSLDWVVRSPPLEGMRDPCRNPVGADQSISSYAVAKNPPQSPLGKGGAAFGLGRGNGFPLREDRDGILGPARSDRGAATQAILMSVYRTLKLRGLNPTKTIADALKTYLKTGQLPTLPAANIAHG